MNIAEIAELFIRAAEVERATPGHVGPAQPRSLQLPYVHDWVDKLGWAKVAGDKLKEDPLKEERRLFWERMGFRASAHELSELERLREWLLIVDDERERRAMLAWSLAKAGGRSFRRWCMKIEGILPETGRKRKNRALAKIEGELSRSGSQRVTNSVEGRLSNAHEIGHVSDTLDEATPARTSPKERSNSWRADPVFKPIGVPEFRDFSWAQKRNAQRRRQREKKRKAAQGAPPAKAD